MSEEQPQVLSLKEVVKLNKNQNHRDLSKMPMVEGANGEPVPSLMIRMRCERCFKDHRILVGADLPLGALPDLTKRTMKCKCKSHIPTITKMDLSLRSINGVPFSQLKGLGMFEGAKWSTN